jgi:hypothetical protein
MTTAFTERATFISKDMGGASTKNDSLAGAGLASLANACMMKARETEFSSQAEAIAMRYAEWHKMVVCRSTTKKALLDAYLKGRQDADTLSGRT